MIRTIAIALALSSVASFAVAQEAATTTVETTNELATVFKAVCDSKANKSKKLQDACNLNEMPKPLKSGKAFRASGIGGEVNVIYNNLELINN